MIEILYIVLAFIFVFPLFWSGVLILLSFTGGWQSLAATYPGNPRSASGTRLLIRFALSRIGIFPCFYNGVLRAAADDNALYLRPYLIFRPGHKALRLPFDDMQIKRRCGVFSNMAFIRMRREPGVRIALSMKDLAWAEAQRGQPLS